MLTLVSAAAAQDEVIISVKPQRVSVVPGDAMAIAVVFDHREGWHIHTNAPVVPPEMEGFKPIATQINIDAPRGVSHWPLQWPEPTMKRVELGPSPAMYGVFGGRAIVYIPVRIAEDIRPGTELRIELSIHYQGCSHRTCLLEDEVFETVLLRTISLDEAARLPSLPADPDFLSFDNDVFAADPAQADSGSGRIVEFAVFGWKFVVDAAGAGIVLLLVVAALGGLVLNLTPCVLPVIPLKIMGLSQAAGNPARCLLLGGVMAIGVVVFWVAIGGAIAFIAGFSAISSLFMTAWFPIIVGAFILVMGIGMLGAFVVQLPRAVYRVNPSHDSIHGSFLFGVMTAILSTPCTAPFMGSAAAWAALQNPAITLATFGAIGAGMALPYLVLSASPRLVARIPRTGPANELIKQTMGILLIAVAVFFIGTGVDPMLREPVDPPVRFYWWIIGGVVAASMLWLGYRTWQITQRPARRAFWTAGAAGFAAVALVASANLADRGPIPWIGYTPDRLAGHRASGKVVVVDFTAEWCFTCKALEAGVLYRPDIVELLNHPDVIPMKVDLTGRNISGREKLRELQRVGIPLLVIYGPGLSTPAVFDTYTQEMVRETVTQARGQQPAQPEAEPPES